MKRTVALLAATLIAVGLVAYVASRPSTVRPPAKLPPSEEEPATPDPMPAEADPDPTPEPEPEPEGPLIRGRVVDEEGRPVAGAKVSWFRGPRVRTDADGRFEIPGTSKARTSLKVDHRRFLLPRVRVDSDSTGHEIVLEEGLSISGRVTTKDGLGAEGIWVTAGRPRARTDANGDYRITGIEAGERSVTCRSPRHRFTDESGEEQTGPKTRTIRAPAGSQGVDFTVTGRPLEVRVIDVDGNPLLGVSVTAWAYGGSHRARRGETGADGRTFTLLPWASRVDVAASAPGYEPAWSVLEPEPSDPRLVSELTLRKPGVPAALDIRAHDELGEPMSHLHLSLLDPLGSPLHGWRDLPVSLNRTGVGRVENLPPGRYAVHFSDARFGRSEKGYGIPVRKTLELTRGETAGVDLTITLGGRVRAVIRGPDGEISWPGQMWLKSLATGKYEDKIRFGRRAGEEFKTAGSARVPVFTLCPVPVGKYEVIARWAGRRHTQLVAPVTVKRCATVEVELQDDR